MIIISDHQRANRSLNSPSELHCSLQKMLVSPLSITTSFTCHKLKFRSIMGIELTGTIELTRSKHICIQKYDGDQKVIGPFKQIFSA